MTIASLGFAGCDGGTKVSDVSIPSPIPEEKTTLNEASLTLNGVSHEFSSVALPSEELTYSVVPGISRTVVSSIVELTGQEDGVRITLRLPLSVEENGITVFSWKEGQMLGFGPTVGGTYFSTDEVLSIDVRDDSGRAYSSWNQGAEGFVEAVRLGWTGGEPIELNFINIVLFDFGKTDSIVLDGSLNDVIEPRVEPGE
ncbi:MAG TPA: hypothetical protein VLJ37_01650 [bacterium]|nr:hypothetical protein [bacterium]